MEPFEIGKKLGELLGRLLVPFLLAWVAVHFYEKIKIKKIEKHRNLKIFLIGFLIILATFAGK